MIYRIAICLAGAASFLAAAPAQGQGYTFFGIPWGTNRAGTDARLNGLGIEQVRDFGYGRVEYAADSSRVFVSFDGDRMVGIQETYVMADAQEAVNLFHGLADSLRQAMGNADSSGVQIRVWKRPATGERLSLEVDAPAPSSDTTAPVVYLSRQGPGYPAFWKRYSEQIVTSLQEELHGWIYERAPASRWQLIYQQSDRGILYERAGVRRTPAGTWRAWFRAVMRDVTTDSGMEYDVLMSDDEVDCAGRRARSHEFVAYLGTDVADSRAGDSPWRRWLPESVGERLYEAFCQRMRSGR